MSKARQEGSVIVRTALGCCGMRYACNPFKIKRIHLPGSCPEEFAENRPKGGHPAEALRAANLLRGYFDGRRIEPRWEWLDLSGMTALQRKVLRAVFDIPWADVQSYGEVALRAGIPRGARFVGNTLARNPLPVFIPCHRVVLSTGELGGFGGGVNLKRRMIEMERRSKALSQPF